MKNEGKGLKPVHLNGTVWSDEEGEVIWQVDYCDSEKDVEDCMVYDDKRRKVQRWPYNWEFPWDEDWVDEAFVGCNECISPAVGGHENIFRSWFTYWCFIGGLKCG